MYDDIPFFFLFASDKRSMEERRRDHDKLVARRREEERLLKKEKERKQEQKRLAEEKAEEEAQVVKNQLLSANLGPTPSRPGTLLLYMPPCPLNPLPAPAQWLSSGCQGVVCSFASTCLLFGNGSSIKQ